MEVQSHKNSNFIKKKDKKIKLNNNNKFHKEQKKGGKVELLKE